MPPYISAWTHAKSTLNDGTESRNNVSHKLSFFFSSRRRHTRLQGDWSSDVCSSDLSNWPLEFLVRGGWPSLDGAVTAWVNSARPAWEFFMKASRLLRPSAHEAVALAAITTAVNRRFILSP